MYFQLNMIHYGFVYGNVAATTDINVEQLKAYLKVIQTCCGLGQVFVT